MGKIFFLNLMKHHIDFLAPVIEARMKLLKNRIVKKYADDWYDLDESQIHSKCIDKSYEFERLNQILNEIYK
jgi:hypothetical protein